MIVADPLAPHTVLQDPMMSALSPIVIAYITDMVSWQCDIKKERMMLTLQLLGLAWSGESVSLPLNFRMPQF